MEKLIIDNAKVMSKGQITLPKEILTQLGIGTGDHVTLICDGDQMIVMNTAIYAMKMLQKGLKGSAFENRPEDRINKLVKEVRAEVVSPVKENETVPVTSDISATIHSLIGIIPNDEEMSLADYRKERLAKYETIN